MSRQSKIAFFVNVYNALVIHAQVEKGFPTNDWKRWQFFNKMSYRIAGQAYSLNDIGEF